MYIKKKKIFTVVVYKIVLNNQSLQLWGLYSYHSHYLPCNIVYIAYIFSVKQHSFENDLDDCSECMPDSI